MTAIDMNIHIPNANFTPKEAATLTMLRKRYRKRKKPMTFSLTDAVELYAMEFPETGNGSSARTGMAATLRSLCVKTMLHPTWRLTKTTGIGRGHAAEYEYRE